VVRHTQTKESWFHEADLRRVERNGDVFPPVSVFRFSLSESF
jgi:hypothetical protein